MKTAAMSLIALDMDLPPVGGDNAMHDGEPQSRALLTCGGAWRETLEVSKQTGLILEGDAGPLVAHRHPQMLPAALAQHLNGAPRR